MKSDYWRLAKMAFIYGASAAAGGLLASTAAKLIQKGAEFFAARRAASETEDMPKTEDTVDARPATLADED